MSPCARPAMLLNTLDWENIILGFKRTTREFLESILENTMESIIVTDLDGKIVFFNKGSEKLFQYSPDEVIGSHVALLGARRPNVLAEIRKGNIFRGEASLMRKAGDRFPAFLLCIPLRDENERPMAMVGAARDLTEEKEKARAEREIARLKEFNENIIASLNDGIQIMNQRGEITFTNRRFEEIIGYEREEILGKHYETLIAGEALERFAKELRTDVSRKGKKVFETTLVTKDGRKLPVLVSASSLYEGGEYKGTINVITDITEINILKEELFQSEKMTLLGKLAGEIAHEINNPLAGLIIATQMLLKDLENGRVARKKLVEELKGIENDAGRCKKFIAKVLDFSRKIPEEMVLLNVNHVIEDALLLVQRQATLDNIEIRRAFSHADLCVRGNSNNLQQIIINMVNNAREAIFPRSGTVTIRTGLKKDERKKWAVIEIEDTGKGIPGAIIGRIFDSFFTTKLKGTGLGLSVSKRIIEEHSGTLVAHNLSNGGALFVITLPCK